MKMGACRTVRLSNGARITITRTGLGIEVRGLDKMRLPNGEIPEPYYSEYRRVLDPVGQAISKEWGAAIAAADNLDPPKIAEFLLTALLKPSHADAVTGDLNEHFTRERNELSRDRAVRLYWARTLRSLWPLLRRAIGKALRWGVVIAAARRLF
jgi:hypothetical protein